MPSLRDYRDRITSVKSTRKITSAMKMVAASKLRRAQEQAEEAQPYANAMAEMMARVAANVVITQASSPLLAGTGSDNRHLLIIMTSDRGLCGGFNANLVKTARAKISELKGAGKEVFVVCVGRKGRDVLKRELGGNIWESFTDMVGKKRVEYAQVAKVSEYVLERFEAGDFDVCTLIYNEFKSVLSQTPTVQQLIPFSADDAQQDNKAEEKTSAEPYSPYDFEPTEEEILTELLPRNIGVQIFRALLDSAAGEQAARMTAMDNATRNAGEMINDLTLQYNRARQAAITKELIEIISGAEAV
ncbi:MAG: F0F1 ATP synthase subunit gamma [Alphaproteobacteria bacterium]|nr:F0F1 ATP synthase subunit gamma [Alphaproteobacteria bacterium]